MNETPSHRRRKGRNAFDPNVEPMEVCPYKRGFMFEEKARDWLDGWEEGKLAWEKECLEETKESYEHR